MSARPWSSLILLIAVCLTTGTAGAQLCGDPDASGTVTVTDGVQVLRQAAGLSSSCTNSTCDIDGNGSVTVTDGVNVLRLAAGLAITENCPTVDNQVQNLLQGSLPVFGALTKIATGQAANAHAAAAETEACDNAGGTITFDPDTGEFDFVDCDSLADGVNFNGFIAGGSDTLNFDITITYLATGLFERVAGSLAAGTDGSVFVFSGVFSLDSSFGGFSVAFDQLVTDADGNFVAGSLAFTVNNGALPEVQSIQLTFDGTATVRVDVGLISGEVVPFSYDLVSGDLTPVSN